MCCIWGLPNLKVVAGLWQQTKGLFLYFTRFFYCFTAFFAVDSIITTAPVARTTDDAVKISPVGKFRFYPETRCSQASWFILCNVVSHMTHCLPLYGINNQYTFQS